MRGAFGMGVTWALGWGLMGIGIGVLSVLTPFLPWEIYFRAFDAPAPALAVPGFFYGAGFSIVLGIVGRNRRFADLSMPRFAAWGALSGVLVPAVLLGLGEPSPSGGAGVDWGRLAFMAGTLGLFSTLSAMSTLALAQRAERGESLDANGATAALSTGSAEIVPAVREPTGERHR